MSASQPTATTQTGIAALILMLTGMILIRTGWAALRHPGHTRFWTDITGLWLTERLWGRAAAEELEHRLRDIPRTKRIGKVGMALGVLLVIAAIVELLWLVL